MTLLYIDGFAHQNANRYTLFIGSWGTNGVSGLGAPQDYYISTPGATRAITASAQVFTGIRLRPATIASGRAILIVLGDSRATTHLTLQLNASGQLELRRGNTAGTVVATGTTVLPAAAWTYIEMRATVADSGGICQVRINGATTNEIDFTGDTKNAGTSTNIDGITAGDGSGQFSLTDWYICDALGSAPTNSWLGDTVVRSLAPSGNGDLSQLTGSDGNSVSNYQQVDELPPSSGDYNGSATSGNEDTYAVADLPSTSATIYGVQLAAQMAKSDAGAATAKPILRLSGTDYNIGGPRTLSTSYAEYLDLYPTSPATSTSWTATEVNGAQIGMQVG